jgi:MoaA/NifB/PqqE/SkfB family radical SAM enzyme
MYAGTPVVVTSDSVAVLLPPALREEPTTLVATVRSPGTQAGRWTFAVGVPAGGARLVISPAHFDHAFLLLDHPTSPPAAFHHEPGSLDDGDSLDLELQRIGPGGTTDALYSLKVAKDRLQAWRALANPPIEWFHVELTNECNLRCPFCPSRNLRRPRAFLSLDDARCIFEKIAAYCDRYDGTLGYAKVQRMVYMHIMGEPLVHPRLVEILGTARDLGILPALFTNALLLDSRRIDAILEAAVPHITISVNAITADGYEALGASGTLGQQEERLIALLRRRAKKKRGRPHVDIQFMASAGRLVVGHGLLSRREEFWRLYLYWLARVRDIEAGADPMVASAAPDWASVLDPLNPRDDPSLRFPLAAGVDLVVKSGCSFGNTILPEGMRVIPTRHGRCPFGSPFRSMAIYCDGSVSFCSLDAENSAQLGNLLESSIDEIWNGERMCTIRREMSVGRLAEPICQRCLGTVVTKSRKE